MDVTVKVDTKGLQSGLAYASQYTKRSLPEMVNTSAYWVAVNAKNNLPFVTPGKIDAELSVITSPVIGKRGKPLKNKKTFSGGMSPLQRSNKAPLAALIVLARTNPNSRYNLLTNQRYALPSLKGMSAAGFHAAVAALVDKMVKLRHRSGKFLVAGWIPAIRDMRHFTSSKFLKSQPSASDGAASFYGSGLGMAKQATAGKYDCFATIENDVGMEGQNAASFNQALMKYGVPATQSAVDREGIENAKYALRKYDEELCREVNKFWK